MCNCWVLQQMVTLTLTQKFIKEQTMEEIKEQPIKVYVKINANNENIIGGNENG